jgi:hypothetical protein
MYGSLRLGQDVSASKSSSILRALVVTLSLPILFWRTPTTFTNPQFWGEDSDFFFRAYSEHWHVLWTPVAGYLVSIQSFAAAASFLPPVAAPFIYNYTAVLLTLATVILDLVSLLFGIEPEIETVADHLGGLRRDSFISIDKTRRK